jgi:flagellar basal body L-ring protein FlgH
MRAYNCYMLYNCSKIKDLKIDNDKSMTTIKGLINCEGTEQDNTVTYSI